MVALGVLLHAIGGFAAGSFYIPFRKVRNWAWESYWLVGVVWSMLDDQQLYMDISHHPPTDADIKDLADYQFPGGGYVFNNVHNIQAGVPPENVVALFDAAIEFGSY